MVILAIQLYHRISLWPSSLLAPQVETRHSLPSSGRTKLEMECDLDSIGVPPGGVEDMITLSRLSEEALLYNIKERYARELIYVSAHPPMFSRFWLVLSSCPVFHPRPILAQSWFQ